MIRKINDFLAGWPMTLVGGIFLLASFILPRAGQPWGENLAWICVVICGIPLLYLAVRRIIYNKGISKIAPVLTEGAGVVTTRNHIHWLVTEYGAVDLYGKSLQERAKLIISIAHPDARESLDRAAFERFGPHYHSF